MADPCTQQSLDTTDTTIPNLLRRAQIHGIGDTKAARLCVRQLGVNVLSYLLFRCWKGRVTGSDLLWGVSGRRHDQSPRVQDCCRTLR